ncbi:Crp/Fnr family transcriptional regulator [Streptomyces sp. 184]|uniref:Crp/Fnr family transcriptional regulator n=1 Tax=Streptomyces sp. 184 TaxID=1827526 RepID=UPI003892B0A1
MGLFREHEAFLPGLGPADQTALLALGPTRSYAPHTTLLTEGEQSTHVLVILDGWCTVWLDTERGGKLILGLRTDGELIGEMAAFDGGRRSASVSTLGPVTGVVVAGDRFRAFLSARPRATSLVLRQLTERLRSSDRERRALASMTVLRRLSGTLVELADHAGRAQGDSVTISLPMPQHELAAAVGSTRDAVAKALRLLRDRGLVRTGPNTLTVSSLGPLRLLAGADL